MKTIKFRFNEIQVKLKKLRSIDDVDVKTFTDKLKSATNVKPEDKPNEIDDALEQWKTLFEFWKREISAAVAWFLSISINRQTITETLRFVSLLIVSLFAGSTQIVKYLGIFAIQLIERTTWLAHVLTPFALGLLDLCSKIVGGLYLLIAMIWRDSVGARRPPPNNAIEAGPRRRPQNSIGNLGHHYNASEAGPQRRPQYSIGNLGQHYNASEAGPQRRPQYSIGNLGHHYDASEAGPQRRPQNSIGNLGNQY